MLQRHALDVARFQVLPHAAPSQQIPAMIRRHAVKPRVEWPRSIVLFQLAAQFGEDLRRGVLGVLSGGHGPPAEPENRGRELAIKLRPGLGIPVPRLSDCPLQPCVLSSGFHLGLHICLRTTAPLSYTNSSFRRARNSNSAGCIFSRAASIE